MEKQITSARVSGQSVFVTIEGERERKLFTYPEELTFFGEEFLGLTEKESLKLYHVRLALAILRGGNHVQIQNKIS